MLGNIFRLNNSWFACGRHVDLLILFCFGWAFLVRISWYGNDGGELSVACI